MRSNARKTASTTGMVSRDLCIQTTLIRFVRHVGVEGHLEVTSLSDSPRSSICGDANVALRPGNVIMSVCVTRLEPLMKLLNTRLAACTVSLAAAALPAAAASSAASSASEGASASVGSVSDSFKKSSDGSSNTNNNLADGDYKVIDVAALPERPGTVRLTLQAVPERGEDSEFALYLPVKAVDQSHLAPGGIVTARHRPYGVEFAGGEPQQAFFLVLDDDWYRELLSKPVAL